MVTSDSPGDRGWTPSKIGWHHRLNGHESEQNPGGGEGQESLACCSPWGRKESDTTERLNSNKGTESPGVLCLSRHPPLPRVLGGRSCSAEAGAAHLSIHPMWSPASWPPASQPVPRKPLGFWRELPGAQRAPGVPGDQRRRHGYRNYSGKGETKGYIFRVHVMTMLTQICVLRPQRL